LTNTSSVTSPYCFPFIPSISAGFFGLGFVLPLGFSEI
jgi:hypothetical protein